MKVIRGGNLSFGRVGFSRPLRPGDAIPFGYVESGTMQIDVDEEDGRYTPAERAAGRATVKKIVFPGYPIPITEDTQFVGTNFGQKDPHAEGVFSIAPGVRVIFGDGTGAGAPNLTNVKIPDEVDPEDILFVQGVHAVLTDTGLGEDHPKARIPLLCECEKCSTYRKALVEEQAAGRWQTHRKHGRIKALASAKRAKAADRDAAVAWQKASNDACAAKYGFTLSASVKTSLGRK